MNWTAPLTLGYYDDWGLTYFSPEDAGLTRIGDRFDIVYFAFITLTDEVDPIFGGGGYRNGDMVDGSMNCTYYSAANKTFETGFCA